MKSMSQAPRSLQRRRLMVQMVRWGALLNVPLSAWAHASFGPVNPPQQAPALRLVGDDGVPFDLQQRLRDKVTAVQLMFTGCSATCPIQGALFASVATQLRGAEFQLLSLSIDPLNDEPKALREWMKRFGAHPAWRAAAPAPGDVDRLLDFLRGRAAGADRHTAQAFLFDRRGQLVFRTAELPTASHIVQQLEYIGIRL
jgi:protein SCO1/2